MSIICTKCNGIGFLKINQISDEDMDWVDNSQNDIEAILDLISDYHDVEVCDCCGDGKNIWYGVPGEHYNSNDPEGMDGPYASSGGKCRCH